MHTGCPMHIITRVPCQMEEAGAEEEGAAAIQHEGRKAMPGDRVRHEAYKHAWGQALCHVRHRPVHKACGYSYIGRLFVQGGKGGPQEDGLPFRLGCLCGERQRQREQGQGRGLACRGWYNAVLGETAPAKG